jgi:dTDP-4-dehydrorhamnose reductase
MRIVVTGAGGMLGYDVLRAGERAGHEMVGMAHEDLDISEPQAPLEALAQLEPEAVVNCAAWTDVDGAESYPDAALAVNGTAAGNLGRAATAVGARLVHVSTDYVFDGQAPLDEAGEARPYMERDETSPQSVSGERAVLGASPRHAVARTAWLFGVRGRNFADTMLTLAAERAVVEVVTDQVGCPTWTGHFAPALLGLIEREVSGLVHLAGSGYVSWNGFAKEIFRQAELRCAVRDSDSAQMARPAARPAWSALESERDDVLPLPPWQDGLAGFLAARAGVMRA